MASEPKRPDDGDNVVSLREARARQAEAQAKADKARQSGHGEKKMPVLLIFLGLLVAVVAVKFLLG
jgi:Flp pilus assembly protein TadB